jgi:hypothetical protein
VKLTVRVGKEATTGSTPAPKSLSKENKKILDKVNNMWYNKNTTGGRKTPTKPTG